MVTISSQIIEPPRLPSAWYNILPDLPRKLPPPKEPSEGPSRMGYLATVMLQRCLEQEVSNERWIEIPEKLRELYLHVGRPRPLYRALRLERALGLSKVRLYYKREDLSPTGSHKVNTALAQAYYAAQEGKSLLVTETGAGQWGTALAHAASLLGLRTVVFWVRAVYNWKRERRTLMKVLGAKVYASPSAQTRTGRSFLRRNRRHPGSLGIAISEGLEYAHAHPGSAYCLGSVLNHVLLHQTLIGLESIEQFKLAGDEPDLLIGCLGGGSNFGGFILPFAGEVLARKRSCKFLAAQSSAAANLVEGKYRYDFGDVSGHTPLLKMYTLGHATKLPSIRADGLRYHAASPIISLLRRLGIVEARAYPRDEQSVFEAARQFLQTEGWLVAPESAYAIRAAIDEALQAEHRGEKKVIGFNISGHGFLDLVAYREKLRVPL